MECRELTAAPPEWFCPGQQERLEGAPERAEPGWDGFLLNQLLRAWKGFTQTPFSYSKPRTGPSNGVVTGLGWCWTMKII